MNGQNFMAQALSLLVECIIQSRVDVKKKQIARFNEFVQEMSRCRHKIEDDCLALQVFDELIMEQIVHIQTQNISGLSSHLYIIFTLNNISNTQSLQAQLWSICTRRRQTDVCQNSMPAIALMFEEILLFLNKQPLFSEYQKDSKLKSEYKIDYKVYVRNQHNAKSIDQLLQSENILKLNHKHVKIRVCGSCVFEIESHSLSSLNALQEMCTMNKDCSQLEREKKSLLTIKPEEYLDDSTEMLIEEAQDFTASIKSRRRLSIYEYYDEKLDFTFLSNDCQSFNSSPKGIVRELEIEQLLVPISDEEFETLQVSKDEQLINENVELLRQLSLSEARERSSLST